MLTSYPPRPACDRTVWSAARPTSEMVVARRRFLLRSRLNSRYFEILLDACHHLRVLGRDVVLLANVASQIVEFKRPVRLRTHRLPVAHTHGLHRRFLRELAGFCVVSRQLPVHEL